VARRDNSLGSTTRTLLKLGFGQAFPAINVAESAIDFIAHKLGKALLRRQSRLVWRVFVV
jgi:hypothetical protein